MKIRCDYSLLQGQNRSHNGFELDDVFGIVDCKSNILNRWVVRALIKINHLDKKWKCYLFFIFRLLKVRYVEDEIPSKYDRLRLIPDAKGGCCYFLGYWQSEKYFKGIEREIRAIFRFKEDEISECSRSIYNPQIQISAESETKRSIFREKDKTKRSKKESAQHSKSRNKSFVMTSVSAL